MRQLVTGTAARATEAELGRTRLASGKASVENKTKRAENKTKHAQRVLA